ALQEKLSVNPTGYFGTLTRAAVLNFQKQYGIEQVGFVGPKTRAKLNELSNGTTPPAASQQGGQASQTLVGPFAIGMTNEQVKLLQQLLAKDPSIYTGEATGYYGNLTQKAVEKFQQKYGIEVTGVAGPKTRAKLNELYAR
ncbi:MAG: Peptidoglycan-binding domain 1 protein, partial [Candidatus Giovannonibacteria bacterium GW2011_GWA1_43_15]